MPDASANSAETVNNRDSRRNEMNLVELKNKNIRELVAIAKAYNIDGASSMRKQELIFALLQAQAEMNGLIYGEGVLRDSSRWLRVSQEPELQLPASSRRYLNHLPDQRRFNLQTGDGEHLRADQAPQGQRTLLRPSKVGSHNA